jgi:beta-lactamase superfamily II metal-dependent hydrolase
VGEDNPFGHLSDEVMERLIEKVASENIYRTSEQGTIEFISDVKKLWVRVGR